MTNLILFRVEIIFNIGAGGNHKYVINYIQSKRNFDQTKLQTFYFIYFIVLLFFTETVILELLWAEIVLLKSNWLICINSNRFKANSTKSKLTKIESAWLKPIKLNLNWIKPTELRSTNPLNIWRKIMKVSKCTKFGAQIRKLYKGT